MPAKMSKSFMTRADQAKVFRAPNGAMIQQEESDLTVSRLADGRYRCYNCPAYPLVDGEYVDHFVCLEVEDMILHIVDAHLMRGGRVPIQRLKRLCDQLGR